MQDIGYELLQSDGTKTLVFTHSPRSLQQHIATTHCNNTLQQRTATRRAMKGMGYELLQSDGTKTVVFTDSPRSLQQHIATTNCNNTLQQHTATTHCNTQGNEGYGLRVVAGRRHENSCLHRLTTLTHDAL